VRSHPWQKIYIDYGVISNNHATKIVEANKENLDYYLNKSQVVITTYTTAGFTALIKGKHLIYWDFIGSESLPFRLADIPVAKSSEEVINSITKILLGKYEFNIAKRKKLINDIFYKLDEKSSLRIADTLYKYLN